MPLSPVHAERLSALRARLRERNIAAVVVSSSDPHMSEYLPDHWQGRYWLSGFAGSVGTAVVSADFAGVWTDSRYFEQAERELAGSGFALMRQGQPQTPEYAEWLCSQLTGGAEIAFAGDALSLQAFEKLQQRFAKAGLRLRTDLDLLSLCWSDRPALPSAAVREHDPAFALDSRAARLVRIRAAMASAGATHHLVSTLDDVAWITSLRGSDVSYNPVFLAHLLIGPHRATLYADRARFDAALLEQLQEAAIDVADYAQVGIDLAALPPQAQVLLDPVRVAVAVAAQLAPTTTAIRTVNPSQALKARKSAAELERVRETMRCDGVALVRFLRWLESSLDDDKPLTELDIATRLHALRSEQSHFVGESFSTIAGYLGNGAMPHYRATATHHARLQAHGLMLVDSGGQYEGGTTDITRTLALGPTTPQQRRDYTLVLKGMIALSRARFPQGTTGQQLDALARAPIWAEAIDYGHGTGHGVGYFLNVHEGPQSIRRPLAGETGAALLPGMITSNEPGIYRPGLHGVRIENLIATIEDGEAGFGAFLAFETLTLCPIDKQPIEVSLLRPDERAWLDGYHSMVFERLAPSLDPAERAWLAERCAAL